MHMLDTMYEISDLTQLNILDRLFFIFVINNIYVYYITHILTHFTYLII